MKKKWIVSLVFWWLTIPVWGQIDSVASHLEKIKRATEDTLKLKYVAEIPQFLEQTAFGSYPLKKRVKYLGYKMTGKEDAELFSWAVPLQQGQAFYNFFRLKGRNKQYLIHSRGGGWLFYDLVPFEYKGRKYYLLLGWNKTRTSNRKVVQVARFEEDGTISFDHPLLRRGKSRSASLSFEYSPEASMMLKQESKGKRIIFDHLSPVDKKYEGYFMFYGPDASYDALNLKGGEWWYEENVEMKR